MLSLVALLSGEEIFQHHYDSEKRADALTAHAKFENKHGDHLTLLNAFKAFRKIEKAKIWCQENYVNPRNLQYAAEVRKQLSEICERLSLDFASCGNNFDQVRSRQHPPGARWKVLTNRFVSGSKMFDKRNVHKHC